MEALEEKYGRVLGDFDTDGILNTALHIRGQQLYMDFYENPALVHHLFTIIAQTHVEIANFMRSRTGTCAVATNRSILNVDSHIYLHSNCSVQMVSPSAKSMAASSRCTIWSFWLIRCISTRPLEWL